MLSHLVIILCARLKKDEAELLRWHIRALPVVQVVLQVAIANAKTIMRHDYRQSVNAYPNFRSFRKRPFSMMSKQLNTSKPS